LINAKGHRIYKILEKGLNISRFEAESVVGDMIGAACMIYEKALARGLKKNQALAEIKTYTLAALVDDVWSSNPNNSARRVGRKLVKHYGHERASTRKRTGRTLPHIHFLREDAFRLVSQKTLLANALKSNSTWDVEYSNIDINRGTKIPNPLDELGAFLLGVYFSIGSPGEGNQFYFNVRKSNRLLVEKMISKCILELFNIKGEMFSRPKNKRSGFNSQKYSFDESEMSITSKAHREFIDKYFRFWTDYDNGSLENRAYRIPWRLYDQSKHSTMIDQRMYYFFMGIIATRGTVQNENNSKILLIFNKNRSLLDRIQEVSEYNDFFPSLKAKNDSYHLRFTRNDLEKMVNSDDNGILRKKYPHLITQQRGLIVNPYHLRQLEKF